MLHYLFDKANLRLARILLLKQDSSLNAVIREFVKSYIGQTQRYQQATEQILQQADRSQFSTDGGKWTREELHER